jgi:hypothetical protein
MTTVTIYQFEVYRIESARVGAPRPCELRLWSLGRCDRDQREYFSYRSIAVGVP